jgi:sialidase-1
MEDADKLSTNGKESVDETNNNNGGKDTTSTGGKTFPLVAYQSIFTPGEEGYKIFRIPAAIVSKAGTVLCFAEGRVNGTSDTGNIDVVLKRSSDGGNTWEDLITIFDDGDNRICNPVPVALDDGRILLLCCRYQDNGEGDSPRIYTIFSEDDGMTWGKPIDITSQMLLQGGSSYMTGPVHGIVKQHDPNKGRICVPARCKGIRSHVIYSDDGGVTWIKGSPDAYSHSNENTITELANGNILMSCRDYNTGGSEWFRHNSISTDGGETFVDSKITSLVEPKSGCEGALLTYSDDLSTGTSVVLFSNPSHPTSRRYGSVKVSYDNGNTWTKMYRYTDDSGNGMYSAYSDLVLLNGGRSIGIIYEAGYKYSGGIVFKSIDFSSIKDSYSY